MLYLGGWESNLVHVLLLLISFFSYLEITDKIP